MKTELERYKEVVELAKTKIFALGDREALFQFDADVNAILNPPPEMETVEVDLGTRWMQVQRGEIYQQEPADHAKYLYQKVKLTGTFTHPKPQPVMRSVSKEETYANCWGIAKVTFTWKEAKP